MPFFRVYLSLNKIRQTIIFSPPAPATSTQSTALQGPNPGQGSGAPPGPPWAQDDGHFQTVGKSSFGGAVEGDWTKGIYQQILFCPENTTAAYYKSRMTKKESIKNDTSIEKEMIIKIIMKEFIEINNWAGLFPFCFKGPKMCWLCCRANFIMS